MPETADPVAALAARELSVRAAGARDLALAGTPDHLPVLLRLALADPSPGVRLGAASATADILSRWRLPPRAGQIPQATRDQLWAEVKAVDPGTNAGIFQVCGTLGVPDAVTRILWAMRDPRFDVRAGAVVGLWRLCTSAAVNGDAELEARVVALFEDSRVRPDTRAELARLCSVVGYTSAIPHVRALAEAGLRNASTIAEEASKRLEWPAPLAGLWADLGIDAGAVDPDATPGDVVALTGSDALVRAGVGGVTRESLDRAPRRLWVKRPGAQEATWAVQVGLTTYWAADADEIGTFGDRLLASDAFGLFPLVDPLLPDTAAAARLRGVVRLQAGDLAGALEYLTAATEMKKVPVDTWWFMADTLHALGRDEDARPHLERYVAKAPKRAPYVEEARKRLG